MNSQNLFKTFLIFSICAPAISVAEDTDTKDEAESSMTLTITATRKEEKKTDVPASIDVKYNDEVALDSPVLQKELLNSISGVRITQTGSTIGHMTSIRLPNNTSPYYLFLQDGIPVQSSGFFNHNGLAYTNYSLSDSTEVLKGAGSALYGSDAVAATINVISKEPTFENIKSIKTEVGSDNFYRLGVNASGQLSENSKGSIQLSHAESDGWRDHTAHERDELSLTHFYEANDNNSLKTVITINNSEAEMSGSLIGLDELRNNPTSVGNIASALESGLEIKRKFDFARISTELNHKVSDTTELNSIVYLRSNRNRYTATWENNLPLNDTKTKTIGLLLKADIEKEKYHVTTGLDIEYTDASRTYDQLFDFTPTGFGSAVEEGAIYDYDVGYFAIAPYLRSEFNITDKVQIGLGLRYDTNSFDYTNNTEDGQYGDSTYLRAEDGSETFEHLSPKLDISYKATENQLLYGRYANGFRIPQASRLYSLRTNNIGFSLDPETSDTFEVGYKYNGEKHEFAASIYHLEIDDTIVRRENEDRDRFYVNGDKTIHQGLELSLGSKINDQLKTKLAYSFSKHNYDNDVELGNNEQAEAPNTVANARLFYTPKQLPKLTTMLEWEHVGSFWLDDANTTRYKGHDIANLKVSYKPTKRLNLTAKVNNITDKTYAETATISFGQERYTPGAPRQFFVGLEYKW